MVLTAEDKCCSESGLFFSFSKKTMGKNSKNKPKNSENTTMARHLICIIHGVGKHDSNKRKERLEEMVKNKDLLLPRVGGDVDFEFRFTEWHRCQGARDVSIFHHLSFLCLLPLPP
jgi:hypothetical protein